MKDNFCHQIKNIALKYDTDNIYILGKGPSIDQIDVSAFNDGVVIGINDAERISPADVSIFHDEWVLESLQLNGYESQLYVTNQSMQEGIPHFRANYVRAEQESDELLVQRFYDEPIYIEDVMLITALKFACMVASLRMRRQQVYLVGFDFDMSYGHSKAITKDFSHEEEAYQSRVISIQEHYLLMFLHLLKESNVNVSHVGNKAYSAIDTAAFNRRFIKEHEMSAERQVQHKVKKETLEHEQGNKKLADGVAIIAEITTNHFGDTDTLKEMVRRASAAGADFVKVQKRDVESFYTQDQLNSHYDSPFGETFRDYRNALELDERQFQILDEECKKHGVNWFLSVLDIPSFYDVLPLNVPFIKLPSTISQHKELLETVAREYKGGVVISTGYTDQNYEMYIIDLFSKCSQLYLLQCNSAYPTPPQDCNISVIRRYADYSRKQPHILPGYSSHDLGSEGCKLAVAAGAKMIEKHVKLGNSSWAHFDSVALDLETDEFIQFVKDIRYSELLCGDEYKKVNNSEHHKYWTRS